MSLTECTIQKETRFSPPQYGADRIISFIVLTNMSISNNNKYLDKYILRVLKLCSHET